MMASENKVKLVSLILLFFFYLPVLFLETIQTNDLACDFGNFGMTSLLMAILVA